MTKEEILEQAGRIIEEEGYDLLTLSALAARIGIQKASLYHYFSSKEEMIDALYGTFSEKLLHRGFRLDFSKDARSILDETFQHWKSLHSSPELSWGLSLVSQRRDIDERAYDLDNSLSLMIRAQSDAVMENLATRGKLHFANPKLLSELFSSACLRRLDSERSEQEDKEFLDGFLSAFLN